MGQPSHCFPKAVDHRQGPKDACWNPHIHARMTAWPDRSICT
jgi:hypothetical protein